MRTIWPDSHGGRAFACRDVLGTLGTAGSKTADEVEALFTAIDADGDGTLDLQEFTAACRLTVDDAALAASVFGRIDADGGGTIDLGECRPSQTFGASKAIHRASAASNIQLPARALRPHRRARENDGFDNDDHHGHGTGEFRAGFEMMQVRRPAAAPTQTAMPGTPAAAAAAAATAAAARSSSGTNSACLSDAGRADGAAEGRGNGQDRSGGRAELSEGGNRGESWLTAAIPMENP